MAVRHKPLSEQVILITGASSGIGRQTAIRAGQAKAKLILVSRDAEALSEVAKQIEQDGGQAIVAPADVADEAQFKAAAEAGVARFGHIDTWVNNAGVGMYTKLLQSNIADDRRLFETNFWGIVNGCRLAVPYLKAAGGGALINLGSEVSDISIPIQGMYATSKHAIMGFTDALRMEIIHDNLPISVTLIKPAAINTPFARHAKNYMEKDATLPAPVYAVDLAAEQVLHAAVFGGRELYVGGGGRMMAFVGNHFPSLSDWFIGTFMGGQQLADRPADHSNEALDHPSGFQQAQGNVDQDRHVQKISFYNIARRNPLSTTFVAAVGVTALGLLMHKPKPKTRWERLWR